MHVNKRVGPIHQSITLAEEVGTMRTLSLAMAGVCSSGVPDAFPEKKTEHTQRRQINHTSNGHRMHDATCFQPPPPPPAPYPAIPANMSDGALTKAEFRGPSTSERRHTALDG
jgi:hypothetical protein